MPFVSDKQRKKVMALLSKGKQKKKKLKKPKAIRQAQILKLQRRGKYGILALPAILTPELNKGFFSAVDRHEIGEIRKKAMIQRKKEAIERQKLKKEAKQIIKQENLKGHDTKTNEIIKVVGAMKQEGIIKGKKQTSSFLAHELKQELKKK